MTEQEGRTPRTLPLKDLADVHASLVGAKALNLGRMMRAGLPVPPGFCVTGPAYRDHVEQSFVASRLDTLLPALETAPLSKQPKLLSELREAVTSSFPSEATRVEIEIAYKALVEGDGGEPPLVAVRSTATAEDLPDHSFAGQHDTYLGIRGLSSVIDAVRRCWASLWTDRAYEYRRHNGIEHRTVDMAVIVQTLVEADAAGILFTADPVSGRKDRMIVEGSFGLGEAVVSSRVSPDRFILDRTDSRVLDRTISSKDLILRVDGRRGVVEEEPTAEKKEIPCLDEEAARRLGEMAVKVEGLFGSPQDVEWAVHEGKVYLLQSRPITNLPPPPAEASRDKTPRPAVGDPRAPVQVWTNANAGEVVPDVVTPFAWSMIENLLQVLFGKIFGYLGADMRGASFMGLHGGRLYFNLNTFLGVIGALPFTKREEFTEIMGGQQDREGGFDLADIPQEHLAQVRLPLWKIVLNLPRLLSVALSYSPRAGEHFVEKVTAKTDDLVRIDPERLSARETLRAIWLSGDDFFAGATALSYPMLGMFCIGLLYRVCRLWFGGQGEAIGRRLTSGLPGMQS
ncbi:MAG: PEP/pyruvate-binding domain-containing protein, partial [Planctomycetota bacterium]